MGPGLPAGVLTDLFASIPSTWEAVLKSSMDMKLSSNGDSLWMFQLMYRPMAGLGEAVTG